MRFREIYRGNRPRPQNCYFFDLIIFSAFCLSTIIVCPHPQHLNLKSTPTLVISHSLLPHGCCFFIFTISPTLYSITFFPLYLLLAGTEAGATFFRVILRITNNHTLLLHVCNMFCCCFYWADRVVRHYLKIALQFFIIHYSLFTLH